MPVKYFRLRIPGTIFLCLLLYSCHHRDKTISFYYWKTNLQLDASEKKVIRNNGVKVLYVRYFDVDIAPGDSFPKPVSPVIFDSSSISGMKIIPVIYIRKRTFEQLDSSGVANLSGKIYGLVSQMNSSINRNPGEIQFDCDWTEKTRDNYFLFLRNYRSVSKEKISATVRLHQVKYPAATGIPPVDYGVLMYYNMGEINAGAGSSIYEKSIAAKYNPSIKTYPLILDVALPIFSWGLQIREGRVIKLLNKMNFLDFKKDSNFILSKPNRFIVRHACFHGGYYFSENDSVKIEYVSEDELLDMIEQVNKYSNHRIRNLIFYELDKENLDLYDKDIFREIMDHTD